MKTSRSGIDMRSRCSMGLAAACLVMAPMVMPVTMVAGAVAAEALTVRVEGLTTPSGHVMIALYDDADAYRSGDEQALRREKLPVGDSLDVVWDVQDLTPGDYGVALFHDINDNEVLDTNFVGMPKEPYGFSNNARGTLGPPNYNAITFTFNQQTTISIQPK